MPDTPSRLRGSRPPTRSSRQLHRLPLGLALVAALPLAGCKKAAPPPPPPPAVVVMTLTATNVPLHGEFIGQLDSPQNVEIRARVEAFVEAIPFIEGSEVETGELLFKLDDRPYQERLAGAKGMLAEAEAALKKYQADVARLRPLAEKRAVPKQDLDNALAAVDVGESAVLSAKARVQSAELDLSYCRVVAPTNGLIGAKQVSIGELVGKGTPTLLATMSTLDPIWFYTNPSEVQYLRAQTELQRIGKKLEDLPITLILATGEEHPAQGRIVFLDRAVDPRTGTLRMRASFPNPQRTLRPGMFARIRVDAGMRANSVVVPERAVTELQGKNFVWVIDAENKATQRPVTVGEIIGSNVLIREGLKPGERIVLEGLQKVREGVVVQPVTPGEAAAQAQAQAQAAHPREGAAPHGKE